MWSFLEKEGLGISGKEPQELFDILDRYVAYVSELCGDRTLHFDVMYNNLGAINPVWSHPSFVDPIFLLKYFTDRGFGIIHIVRERVFDAFVSDQVARTRGLYHSTDESSLHGSLELEVDLKDLEQFCRKNLQTRALVQKQLSGYKRCTEIFYPDFIRGGTVLPEAEEWTNVFGDFTGLFGHSPLKKTTKMDRIRIVNKAEACLVSEKVESQIFAFHEVLERFCEDVMVRTHKSA